MLRKYRERCPDLLRLGKAGQRCPFPGGREKKKECRREAHFHHAGDLSADENAAQDAADEDIGTDRTLGIGDAFDIGGKLVRLVAIFDRAQMMSPVRERVRHAHDRAFQLKLTRHLFATGAAMLTEKLVTKSRN